MLQTAHNMQCCILFPELFTVTSLVHYLSLGLMYSMLLPDIMPLNNSYLTSRWEYL